MNIITILLAVSVLVNIVFIFIIRNLLFQTEAIEDTLVNTVADSKEKIKTALDEMKAADIRGSFEADDEVGGAFKDIKNVLDELNEKF